MNMKKDPPKYSVQIQSICIVTKGKWCDDQQFHQHQQNEQSPITFTQWTQKAMINNVGNPGPGLGQAQNCGTVIPGNEI